MHWASGFNELFEYLTIKETNTDVHGKATEPGLLDSETMTTNKRSSHTTRYEITTQYGNLPVLNPRTKRGRKLAAKHEMAGKVREDALVVMEHFKNMPELKWSSGVDMELSEL